MTLSAVRLAAVLPTAAGNPVAYFNSWAALWCVQRWPGWGGLWSKVVAGVQLPLDARVLLAGDHPGGGDAGRALWTHLRLLFCRAVWHLRCHRVATGKVFTAAAVVGLTAAWVGRAIRLDWLRVVADLTRARTLPSWCIIHKRFNLSQADFSKRWCLGDVLAQVSSDGSGLPILCVHVPTAIPVPAEPAALAEAAASAAPVAAL